MDGTTRDRIVEGSLFREASLSHVLKAYPQAVLSIMATGRQITHHTDAEGREFYTIRRTGRPEVNMSLRAVDFERCLAVARKIQLPRLFRSSPHEEVVARIQAYLRVEFSDRRD